MFISRGEEHPVGSPPSDADWSQPATKGDIARLDNRIGMTEARLEMTETRLTARCDVLESRIDAVGAKLSGRIEAFQVHVDHKISRLTWTMIVAHVATVLALGVAVLACP